MNYLNCPNCGQSDGADDLILYSDVEDIFSDKIIVREKRRCDICGHEYEVFIHYNFVYESYA